MEYTKKDISDTKLSMNTIYNMDCIEGMKLIPDGSIDCIITDPPYWTTACKRDTVIPFDLMREQLNRIIKPNGAIVLFWSEPFSSHLRMSNIKNYKYDWIWEKNIPTWMTLANTSPMKLHEIISVFSDWNLTYSKKWNYLKFNPQKILRDKPIKWYAVSSEFLHNVKLDKKERIYTHKNPVSIIKYDKIKWGVHPTQKPVALIEYLIKTYTNEWETVLDFTMWSWTTAVACLNTNRNFIWFELDEWYRNIANKRIQDSKSDRIIF